MPAIRNNMQNATELFDQYGTLIKTTINCRVKDEHLRNDLYSDFFLHLLQKPLPEGIENTEAYLYRMVCNEVNLALRKQKKYREHLNRLNLKCIRRNEQSLPESSITTIEESRKIIELIDLNLGEPKASIIKLKHRDGLSNVEIAKKLRLNKSTVDVYCTRAMKKIREIFRKREGQQ